MLELALLESAEAVLTSTVVPPEPPVVVVTPLPETAAQPMTPLVVVPPMQLPLEQVCPVAQVTPQPPQLFTSVVVLRHMLLQKV